MRTFYPSSLSIPNRLRSCAIALALFALGISTTRAQPFVIDNTTDNTCVGAFLDSGGQGAQGYGNNEDYTYTLCPNAPGSRISVSFVTALFSLAGNAPADNMTIYDGPNTGSPLIGNYTGDLLQGQTISASAGNASGCLTFVWHSNNAGTDVFAGAIHCYVPCAHPVAGAVMGVAAPARVCPNGAVTFNGSSSIAQPGFNITSWYWDFDDGTNQTTGGPNVSHNFAVPGVHQVHLTVTDNNNCASQNTISLPVWVAPPPTFTGTIGGGAACAGEQICLQGQVNATTYEDDPGTTYGAGVFVPDDV
ncbi:MAG TPA: PKD domain-containing protein, partial [Flavobacteriales bacterium]|nr:PKD domain-containing protein [Flavobacteriales bacterium]